MVNWLVAAILFVGMLLSLLTMLVANIAHQVDKAEGITKPKKERPYTPMYNPDLTKEQVLKGLFSRKNMRRLREWEKEQRSIPRYQTPTNYMLHTVQNDAKQIAEMPMEAYKQRTYWVKPEKYNPRRDGMG